MKALVLGGGITGLAAAWRLASHGYDVTVIERSASYGGLAATFRHKEFLLDYGPHKIYTQLPVMEEFKRLMGDELLEIPKRSRIRLQGTYFEFPVQMKQILLKLHPLTSLHLGFSYLRAMLSRKRQDSYASYLTTRFGKGTYDLIFKPYAEKIWGTPTKLSPEMASTRVAAPNLLELVKRVIFGDRGKAELSAKTFYYPKKGVIQMSDMFARRLQKLGGAILTSVTVTGMQMRGNRIVSVQVSRGGKNRVMKPDIIVSTIPLPALLGALHPTDKAALASAQQLMLNDLSLLYIIVDAERLFPDSWLFFPEKSYIFNRISEQKAFSQFMIPSGKTVLAVEITHPDWVHAPDQELYLRAVADLERAGILRKEQVVEWFIRRIPKVYQIYDVDCDAKLRTIFGFTDRIENLYSIGRNGAFSYCGTMDGIDMAFKTGDFIAAGRPHAEWAALRATFRDYKVID